MIRDFVFVAMCLAICAGALLLAYQDTPPAAVVVPARFSVISQQYLDSGAKLIIFYDKSSRKCHGVYEAGAGAYLGEMPCK